MTLIALAALGVAVFAHILHRVTVAIWQDSPAGTFAAYGLRPSAGAAKGSGWLWWAMFFNLLRWASALTVVGVLIARYLR